MTPFGHFLVLALFLNACQSIDSDRGLESTTLSESTEPTKPTEEPTSAPVEFTITSKKNGSLALKIKVVKKECTDFGPHPEEPNSKPLGSYENPANSCRDINQSGDFFMNYSEPFKVYCNYEEKTACFKQNLDQDKINKLAIQLDIKKTWMSDYTEVFETKSLYYKTEDKNSFGDSPISYLLSTKQIKRVTQEIRYYYSNGKTTKSEDAKKDSLAFLLWNGQFLEKDKTPLKQSFRRYESCWGTDKADDAISTKWVCHDIVLKDNSNKRLPVTDVYIGDLIKVLDDSAKPIAKIYFGLVNFCIHYRV